MHALLNDLRKGSQQLGLSFSEGVLLQLLAYQDQLHLWNKAYNLTAIRQPKDMLVKHVLDSLSIIPHLPAGRLLDVGTGGGLPGMVIAICQPERECVLLDSNGKKIRFLVQTIADMKLPNVRAVQGRIEDPTLRASLGHFEVITSRAFSSLLDFVRDTRDWLDPQGSLIAMKGVEPVEEMQQLTDFQCVSQRLTVPGLEEQRHVLTLKPISDSDT